MATPAPSDRTMEGRASRGPQAELPQQIPAPGWRDILWRVKQQLSEHRISIVAAGVAYYFLLAVFPALTALVALYGLAFDPREVSEQIAALRGMLPPQAADILLAQLRDLAQTNTAALSLGAIGGLLVAFWSASAGVRTLMEALNIAYDEEEKRGFLKFYGTALLLTLAAIVSVMLAIGAVVALPVALEFLGWDELLEGVLSYARWPILAIMMMLGLAIVYRYGPSRDQARWAWASAGAVLASVLWLAGSALFSWYVTSFANYNKTYGSVGAVVILLTWFLLSAYSVLLGAELNAEMERQARKDRTKGQEQPLGRRRAYAADTMGEAP